MPDKRLRIILNGCVQGVGLRPALYRYARELSLGGHVYNSSGGAVLEVEGPEEEVLAFFHNLAQRLPAGARLNDMKVEHISLQGEKTFTIVDSRKAGEQFISAPPDLRVCEDCEKEMSDPSDRRYRYPFINCTNCGPRFSILKNIPYDRINTTMSGFALCPSCLGEYSNPLDRRFHAEPIACPLCGPKAVLHEKGGVQTAGDNAVRRAAVLLLEGKIVAIKSIGGFHLACIPTRKDVVANLRGRKNRPHKPFAVMVRDTSALFRFARPSLDELNLLTSSAAPIVMLEMMKPDFFELVSPGLSTIGVMMPYTPLHCLLFQSPLEFLVMTSGNKYDEPICKNEEEAFDSLGDIADAWLTHDRPIENRLDDSVMFVAGKKAHFTRRARGFVPRPVYVINRNAVSVLSVGAELKNTYCLMKGGEAYMSSHIGDLSHEHTLSVFEESLVKFKSYLNIEPSLIAHDLHPDYLSTRWAKEAPGNPELVAVQHHHAHIASVMAEHAIEEPVIGVAFDGAGLGLDGTIWGGEFLIVDSKGFKRAACIKPFPIAGGDIAAVELWRSAYGVLAEYFGVESASRAIPEHMKKNRRDIEKALRDRKLSPLCSSLGRFLDALSCMLKVRDVSTYEGQAAMELESLAASYAGAGFENINFSMEEKDGVMQISLAPILKYVMEAGDGKSDAGKIAARAHHDIVSMIVAAVKMISADTGIKNAAISGGCFQNKILLEGAMKALSAEGFTVYANEKAPANDGGIALGQAWVASRIKADT